MVCDADVAFGRLIAAFARTFRVYRKRGERRKYPLTRSNVLKPFHRLSALFTIF